MEDLFGFVNTKESSNIEWSYSRRSTLEQCPLRYYYQYYGTSSESVEPNHIKSKLSFLKSLGNRYTRTGYILHLVIRTYFNKLRNGESWNLNRLQNWAKDIYHKDKEFSHSHNLKVLNSPNGFRPVVLSEFYHRMENAEKLVKESEERMLAAIENFMVSDKFSFLKSGGSQPDVIVEKQTRLNLGNVRLRGQIDLAYLEENVREVVICDWKIGGDGEADSGLQLQSYALWGVEAFKCEPEKVTVMRAHLSDNQLRRFDVTDTSLNRAKARIIQDIERMNFVHEYGKKGIVEVFTPCLQPRICALCPFLEFCPKK